MNFRNEKGITLIALGVTIVVMAILATITITATVGDEGVVNQAQIGTIKASIREVEEALDTYILLKEKEKIQNGDFTDVTLEELVEVGILGTGVINAGYTEYVITNLDELNIKGDYGNGTDVDIFKVKEKDGKYEIVYVLNSETTYTK